MGGKVIEYEAKTIRNEGCREVEIKGKETATITTIRNLMETLNLTVK